MHAMTLLSRVGLVSLGCLLLVGCGGGNTADVSGTVTMDGEPLEGAIVMFMPESTGGSGGRPASAVTDAEGNYELVYGRGATGAVPGTYQVSIRTYRSPNEDAETPEEKAGRDETVPARYNADTELVETVEADGGVIDFELSSEGEIKLPPGAGGGYGGY